MITQKRLKELLRYDPQTGEFRWRFSRPGCSKDTIAGTSVNGYVAIKLDRQRYLAHRLAFLYMAGEMPDEVDHINRRKTDNRWDNLRDVCRSTNHANSKMHSRNTSGVRGVCWHKRHEKWWAYINWKGVRTDLGMHDTLSAATKARRKAEQKYFGQLCPT